MYIVGYKLKNKVDSIRRSLKAQGIIVASDVARAKILELFPYEVDWIVSPLDCRRGVIAALAQEATKNETSS